VNPIIHKLLYTMATVVIPFVTGAVGLYYSIIGYQHTKLRGFLYWIWAASLGLVGHIFLLIVYTPPAHFPKTAYHGLWIFWCVGYSTSALLGTWGTILLVRYLISRAHDNAA
jgi:hypothetical protein